MMLAVLGDVFVGNPMIMLSNNVARARVAFGFDPTTNYMFPKTKAEGQGVREFVFEHDECLFEIQNCRSGCNKVCLFLGDVN